MRQFGLKQMIPTPFSFDSTHFHHDRRGRPNTNWELKHAQWLPFWNQQLQYICDVPINREPLRYDDPYLIWFRRITRLVIGKPTLRPQQQGYVPNSTAYETMIKHFVGSSMTYQPTNSEIVPYMMAQISRDPSLSSLENVFDNYQPQHFENAPNFTSSLVSMSMEILDAMTNLEDSNIEIEGNELDDSNNEVDGNDPENASGGGEPSEETYNFS
ncbi:hypothetical protein AABB24_030912 [Solanum stoloniferum]|uniref:Aminotransferase-like plant mobile domain-containing protein n=1 Tax=Solanum stoloniferum TaxID=62892 RepID=A0ABD2RRA7_9SOLN